MESKVPSQVWPRSNINHLCGKVVSLGGAGGHKMENGSARVPRRPHLRRVCPGPSLQPDSGAPGLVAASPQPHREHLRMNPNTHSLGPVLGTQTSTKRVFSFHKHMELTGLDAHLALQPRQQEKDTGRISLNGLEISIQLSRRDEKAFPIRLQIGTPGSTQRGRRPPSP